MCIYQCVWFFLQYWKTYMDCVRSWVRSLTTACWKVLVSQRGALIQKLINPQFRKDNIVYVDKISSKAVTIIFNVVHTEASVAFVNQRYELCTPVTRGHGYGFCAAPPLDIGMSANGITALASIYQSRNHICIWNTDPTVIDVEDTSALSSTIVRLFQQK